MIQATTEVQGDKPLGVAFAKVEEIFKDYTSVFGKIASRFYGIIQRRFRQEGPGWQPLSPAYAARKAQIYGNKTILRATDALYNSFQPLAPGNVQRINKTDAELGTNIFYGIFHQLGTSRMPARTIINITPQEEIQFAHIAIRDLNAKIKELGFGVTNVVESS